MGKAKVNLPHQKITDFCKKNHIIRLSLFGSVLRDDFHLDSDIDFLVEFKDGAGLLDLSGLGIYLEELLGIPVDIVSKRALRKELESVVYQDLISI